MEWIWLDEAGDVTDDAFRYLGVRVPTGWPLRHVVDTAYDRRFLKSLRISPMGRVSQESIDARAQFKAGDKVRYTPSVGTYGYEDLKDPNGTIAGVVIGITEKRVRVRFGVEGGRQVERAVDAVNLAHVTVPGV